MPAVSQSQYRLMQMVKHNAGMSEKTGIPQSVASDFTGVMPKGLPQRVTQGPSPAAKVAALRAIKP